MADHDTLAVMFRAGPYVYAVDVGRIERLVLSEELDGLAPAEGPRPAVLGWRGERYAGWDLARLLGYASGISSCMLLRLPLGPQWVPIALQAGACLLVKRLPAIHSVPDGTVVRRRGLLSGIFSTAGCGTDLPPLGFVLDPGRLLTAAELAESAAVVDKAAA